MDVAMVMTDGDGIKEERIRLAMKGGVCDTYQAGSELGFYILDQMISISTLYWKKLDS